MLSVITARRPPHPSSWRRVLTVLGLLWMLASLAVCPSRLAAQSIQPSTATDEELTTGVDGSRKTASNNTGSTLSSVAQRWSPLWNGHDLKGWRITNFGGEGEVEMKDGSIVLHMGSPLTGITRDALDPFPTCGYELQLEARRIAGTDFFCGLTFPYQASHASLILGGWGGGVVGISCVDGYDASENETTRYRKFELDRWYTVRLRVTPGLIEAWIDDDRIVDCELGKRPVSVRSEVELSRPLGLCAFETQAELRHFVWRPVLQAATPFNQAIVEPGGAAPPPQDP